MAFLFIKQKFFLGQINNRRSKDSSKYTWITLVLQQLANPTPRGTGKPLLSPEGSDTLQGSSESDLESQRSYSTFRNTSDLENNNYDTDSTSSGSTRARINPRIVSDAILGLSDGLTVPFALSAGLSALGKTKVVVLGGLAELTAGALSMGLGGYVGAKSEAYVFPFPGMD